ncbi:MAG: SDR family NAD(P)-dependent oxidoreductase [Candidatus Binatia bacterium]|nr:SDR family NAD(P)-dependent oxidoreductase [Candidatus Binatia bacterium]
MDTRNLRGKTALVTGAGSGIGKETALLLGTHGADLVLCDVDEKGLAETEASLREMGREVFAMRVDVADREQMSAFANAVHERIEAVDLLVNNAGVGLGGGFADTSLDDWDWILGINLKGVVHGCHFFVPKMVARGAGGHVVNVSSSAGFFASEALCAYSTTKFGVLGLSEALREELHRSGIGVSTICPGIIDTQITKTSRFRGAFDTTEMREQLVGAYAKRNYTPARVAKNILKAVDRNRGVTPVSPEAWIMYYMKRLIPVTVGRVSRIMGERQRRSLEN